MRGGKLNPSALESRDDKIKSLLIVPIAIRLKEKLHWAQNFTVPSCTQLITDKRVIRASLDLDWLHNAQSSVCAERSKLRGQTARQMFQFGVSEDLTCRKDNCDLLGCYAAGSGNFLPTFRDNLPVPFSEVKNPKESFCILDT